MQTSDLYKGPIDCFNQLVKNEGVKGLFSGMGPPLLTSIVVNAIIFTSYQYTLKFLRRGVEGKETPFQMFAAGMSAGFAQSFLTAPAELLKIRLQTDNRYHNSIDVARQILKKHGFGGFYRGYMSTLYRELPAFGSYFTTYYLVMDALEGMGEVLPSFIAGGCAGAASWSIVYPIDIAKTTIQMSDVSSKSTVVVLREMWVSHGFKYLYRGLGTTIVRSLPVNAVVFPVYEFMVKTLSQVGGVE